MVYIGGADTLDDLDRVRRAGFELIALGRPLIHPPDLPAHWRDGIATASECDRCNECIAEMSLPGGVVCAKAPWQVERRRDEVRRRLHLAVASS